MSRFCLCIERLNEDPCAPLLSRLEALGYTETAEASAFASIELLQGKREDADFAIVVASGPGATQSLAESIAAHFVGRGARAFVGFIHVPLGQGGRNVIADVRTYDSATVTVDEGAQAYIDELRQTLDETRESKKKPSREDDTWLESFLFDKLPIPVSPTPTTFAVLASACATVHRTWLSKPSRIAALLDAIRSGQHVEWLQVQGHPALKLKAPDGASRISVLDDREREQVEAALAERPARDSSPSQ